MKTIFNIDWHSAGIFMLTTLLVWSVLIVLTIMSVHHVVTPLPVSV